MAERNHFDLVCIGSGPAGHRAAIQAAKLGKRVAIIERRRVVGGVCVDSGTIPSKTFREAVVAVAGTGARGHRRWRIRSEDRPSAAGLLARVSDVVETEADVLADQLYRNDIKLLRGSASFLDPHTIEVATDELPTVVSTDFALIAVGTRPIPPPGLPEDGEIVITSDGITRLKSLPKTMAVVGAGVVGIEYASMFAALDIKVTVVDKRDRPLEFLDREIVDEMLHQMRQREVTFRFGEAVERLDVSASLPRRAVLLLESGKRIVSDLVLYTAGRVGSTGGLGLEKAGVSVDDKGRIAVDESFRTSAPHIFAAGDVIGYPSLAATSAEQGRLAACHAFGLPAGRMPTNFPFGIYAIPEISMVGATEAELTAKRVPYEVGVARYSEIARGQILGDDSGLFKMLFHREDGQLLGAHAIGTGATELIHIAQAVLTLGGGLDYFLDTVFNYPTLAECYKVAALDAANRLAR